MWIVKLALRRPYTFVVAAMLILLWAAVHFWDATDIFPEVRIPVIAVAFNYTGMSAQDMELRIVSPYEKILTTTVMTLSISRVSRSMDWSGEDLFQKNAKIEVGLRR